MSNCCTVFVILLNKCRRLIDEELQMVHDILHDYDYDTTASANAQEFLVVEQFLHRDVLFNI
jgi:predicted hydrolase (HD superfamily)